MEILFKLIKILTLGFIFGTNIFGSDKNLNSSKFHYINPCELFPKEFIEDAIGRKIIKIEEIKLKSTRYCFYYTSINVQSGSPNIAIGFANRKYKKINKELKAKWNNKFTKDNRIQADHYLTKKGEEILKIDLFLNEKEYLEIKSNQQAVSSEELIKIALKVLDKKPELFYKKEKIVPFAKGEDIIYNFSNLIEEKKYIEAVNLIKTNSEDEQKAWKDHFSNIRKFKVLKVEKAKSEEWTRDKYYYKVIFEVLMDSKSKDAPIPYYGWENGENSRWITIEKVGNTFKISEISTSP